MLENVDRLLKSPTKQRGRDFGVMLASLSDLGYSVEWRIINAADYGMPQRRRRVYIMAYKNGTVVGDQVKSSNSEDWLLKNGLMQKAFPTQKEVIEKTTITLDGSLADISENKTEFKDKTPFLDCGLMVNRHVTSFKTKPKYSGKVVTLGDVLLDEDDVEYDYWISDNELEKWKYLKGAKKETRKPKRVLNTFTLKDRLRSPTRKSARAAQLLLVREEEPLRVLNMWLKQSLGVSDG